MHCISSIIEHVFLFLYYKVEGSMETFLKPSSVFFRSVVVVAVAKEVEK